MGDCERVEQRFVHVWLFKLWSTSTESMMVESLFTTARSTSNPTPALVKDVLTNGVRPLFIATPHPRLHTETARVLARPADSQDPFHHQPWKDYPDLDEVVRWCILNTQVFIPSLFLRLLTTRRSLACLLRANVAPYSPSCHDFSRRLSSSL